MHNVHLVRKRARDVLQIIWIKICTIKNSAHSSKGFSVANYIKYRSDVLALLLILTYFLTTNPYPPCELCLWEETGEPGENPWLSAEYVNIFTTLPTSNQMFATGLEPMTSVDLIVPKLNGPTMKPSLNIWDSDLHAKHCYIHTITFYWTGTAEKIITYFTIVLYYYYWGNTIVFTQSSMRCPPTTEVMGSSLVFRIWSQVGRVRQNSAECCGLFPGSPVSSRRECWQGVYKNNS